MDIRRMNAFLYTSFIIWRCVKICGGQMISSNEFIQYGTNSKKASTTEKKKNKNDSLNSGAADG